MQYTVEIFESADSSINEYLATIFVGIALLVSYEVALLMDALSICHQTKYYIIKIP